jgi:hypothetical protein
MHPIEFEGSRMIGKPDDMTDEQCFGIPAGSGIDDEMKMANAMMRIESLKF